MLRHMTSLRTLVSKAKNFMATAIARVSKIAMAMVKNGEYQKGKSLAN